LIKLISTNPLSDNSEWLEYINDYESVPASEMYANIARSIVTNNTPPDVLFGISAGVYFDETSGDEIYSWDISYIDYNGFCFIQMQE